MTDSFTDRFLEAARRRGAPVCVGLDPVHERLPSALQAGDPTDAHACAAALRRFSVGVLDAVAGCVPCVKIQTACYERYQAAGVDVLYKVIEHARSLGLLVITDAKRGDIGISSSHYAAAFLDAANGGDALTVHSYLGRDSLDPFVEAAARHGKAVFPMVRTSNPGGDALQSLPLADGRTVAEAVADMVAQIGEAQSDYLGRAGYSLLGAVVGATKPEDARALRQRMPRQLFLVPGYGAQGGSAEDVRACFHPDGTGAIITASRSVIYAYDKADADWQTPIAAAAGDLSRQIADILR